jgi:alpha-glucosidase
MVDWYHRVVRLAAQYHLMVDFHGAYKPTGIRRTWPNLVTREGVQGQEYSKWSFGVEPEHNVMIAFTRLLAGPMDFTPGGFDNVTREQFVHRRDDPMVMGTRAHNLAMLVVYESPFLVVCDHPSAYRGQPGYEFLKAVPAAAWDETRVVNALPGDYITIARRKGEEWFIGTMNDWTARDLEIPLSFLGDGTYVAEIYSDGADADANPKSLSIERSEVTATTTLKVRLTSGGGQAIRIARQ